MDEKTMCYDVLSDIKSELSAYAMGICEANNAKLRQSFQQIRNDNESSQYELYKICETKGYYKPAENAPEQDVQTLYNEMKCC